MNKKLNKIFVAINFLQFLSLHSTVEYLDTSFGINANGIVETAIGTSSKINGISRYQSGKIITAGLSVINNVQNLALTRYNSTGRIDMTFGSNGVVTLLTGSSCYANAVTFDASNKILAAGTAVIAGSNYLLIVRFNSDGTSDLNFGTGGIVTKLIGTSTIGNSIILDADGKIIVAGTAISGGKNNLFVVRYNTNGTIDTTFGSSGVKTLTASSGYTGNSVQIEQNAKIVVGGSVAPNSTTANFLVVRLNVNGSNDAGFGSNGIVTTAIPSATVSAIKSIAIDASNKIVAGGYSGNGTNSNFTTARYNTNGTLDNSYGTNSNGIQVNAIGTNSQINALVLDLDAKIVSGGFSDNQFAIARYSVNGSLDTTFGFGGILTTPLGNSAQINSLLIQLSDGRIVAGGSANDSGQLQFTSLRYNKNNIDFVNITSVGQTVNTKTPIIAGTSSAANANVEVFINDVLFASAPTNGVGDWTVGQTSVLPVGQNRIQVNLIVSSVVIVSQAILINVLDNLSDESAFAYSTQAQTTNNPEYEPLAFNEIPKLGTWTYSDSVFTCKKSGIYVIQYTGNANINGNIGLGTSAVNVAMSVAINNIEYLGSETDTDVITQGTLTQNHYAKTLTRSFIKTINQGDTLTLNFAVSILGDNTGFTAGLMNNPNAIGTQPCYSLTITRIG